MRLVAALALSVATVCLSAPVAIAQEGTAGRVPLLNVTQGQLPNDTSQENQTKLTIEDSHPELTGKVLKVVFAAGDTFGMSRGAAVKNWKPFTALEFNAFNPGADAVNLTLAIKHGKTTGFPTRIDIPVTLKPGKNAIRLNVANLLNTNGSTPEMGDVTDWYFATETGKAPTLFFNDLWLAGGAKVNAAPLATAIGQAVRLTGTYRVRGKIGGQDVDLTITPEGEATAGSAAIKTDPARLARIRAAKMPEVTKVVEFNTPEADAILSALEVFPPNNAINQIVDEWPVHPNSAKLVASIGADKPLRYNPDMAFIIVPPNQPKVDLKLLEYPGESDKGPYPVPANIPVEGWPVWHKAQNPPLTLEQAQVRPEKYEGDRHAIVVDPINKKLYEFFTFGKAGGGWAAGQASIFDLTSNALRPESWTSADAAGLPIFPTVVRFDELERGSIDHALRFTIRKSRRAYVHPATHYASRDNSEDLPRMGERFRLKADFDVTGFSPQVQTILKCLKKYGMLVADNGIEWAISVTPDPRIPVLHPELRKVKGSDFEVVVAPQ